MINQEIAFKETIQRELKRQFKENQREFICSYNQRDNSKRIKENLYVRTSF